MNDTKTASPIKGSSQARSKLKAFQFIEGKPDRPAVSQQDQENDIAVARNVDTTEHDVTELPHNAVTADNIQSRIRPPSTPATRLPLADLVGNAEDAAKQSRALIHSPDEHIDWYSALSPGRSRNARTPTSRGKKRARSSSPIHSSQTDGPAQPEAEKGPFDVQHLQSSLKTPQADPAADLWSRYAVGAATKDTPTVVQAPRFAHLIERSSPAEESCAGSVGGLRRWASCGIEWPTSKAKRRKISTELGIQLPVPEEQAENGGHVAEPNMSKVSLLVDRIHESLTKPPPYDVFSGPSSSSPLPEGGRSAAGVCASPLGAAASRALQRKQKAIANDAKEAHSANDTTDGAAQPNSSDFEAIDLDSYMEGPTNLPKSDVQPDLVSKPPLPAHDWSHLRQHEGEAVNQNHRPPADEDEFDDFDADEDQFAADLENLASMYDTQPDQACAGNSLSHTASNRFITVPEIRAEVISTTKGDEVAEADQRISDDEFGGDDIDMEHLTAAEAATQSFRGSHGTQGPVRVQQACLVGCED